MTDHLHRGAAAERRREIRSFLEAGDHEGLLRFFWTLSPDAELGPSELVAKGRAILLGPEENPFSLEDAEQAFSLALDLDPTYLPALLELAWYYYAVQDDPRRASPLFVQALESSRRQLTGAAQGQAGCLAEVKSAEEAADFLRGIHGAALLVTSLGEEERSWLGVQQNLEELPGQSRGD